MGVTKSVNLTEEQAEFIDETPFNLSALCRQAVDQVADNYPYNGERGGAELLTTDAEVIGENVTLINEQLIDESSADVETIEAMKISIQENDDE